MGASILSFIADLAAIAAGLWTLGRSVALLTATIAIFTLIFDPKGSEKVGHLIGNIIRSVFQVATPILADVEKLLAPVAQSFVDSVNANGGAVANIFRDPAKLLATTAFNDAAGDLIAGGESTTDNAVRQATSAIGEAFAFGAGSAAVTAAFEAVFPEKLNTLNFAGPLFAKMAGFDEVAAAVRQPLYEAAFGRSLQYHYRSTFKPDLPRAIVIGASLNSLHYFWPSRWA